MTPALAAEGIALTAALTTPIVPETVCYLWLENGISATFARPLFSALLGVE